MCTAIAQGRCFGRNLDLEYGYDEQVVIMPRRFPLPFRRGNRRTDHYAFVGMATVDQGYPLYYDAVNENGLAMAGLDFPGNAFYPPELENGMNIAPFELIPWVLCQCGTVEQARKLLTKTHLADIAYSEQFPQAPLHWMIADKTEAIVLEPMRDGLKVYYNPVGVLTNNPPFPYHLSHLAGYQHLSPGEQQKNFEGIDLPPYGGGMGAIGLPGDFSSPSRFVKAAFVKLHSHCEENHEITEFFHLLDTVAMPRGSVRVRGEKHEITRYSCCCDLQDRVYYYSTYENRRVQAVQLHRWDLDGSHLLRFSIPREQDIHFQEELLDF